MKMAVVSAKLDPRILVDSMYGSVPCSKSKFNSENDEDKVLTEESADATHIQKLIRKLPALDRLFDLRKKIGEGTFSSVYLAALKCQESLKENEKKMYAIKHLVPTSHPSRIEQELWCLQYIGGSDNVIGVELCLRKFDTVVFVMQYIPHEKFSEYMLSMDVDETRSYIKALLIALKRVHQFGVIHRDVKPSNFLYDRQNKRFLLVDFGLAQRLVRLDKNSSSVIPFSEKPKPLSIDRTYVTVNRKRKRSEKLNTETTAEKLTMSEYSTALKLAMSDCSTALKLLQRDHLKIAPVAKVQVESTPQVPKMDVDISVPKGTLLPNGPTSILDLSKNSGSLLSFDSNFLSKMYSAADQDSYPIDYSLKSQRPEEFRMPAPNRVQKCTNSSHVSKMMAPSPLNGKTAGNGFKIDIVNKMPAKDCRCYGRPMICNTCLVRSGGNAPRAGTQGFRPPEVLLKYQEQTTAVDIWACGVIFLSILSGRYPFFKATDDITALAELVSLFGSEKLQKIAARLGKHLLMSHNVKEMDLADTCRHLRRGGQCQRKRCCDSDTFQNSDQCLRYGRQCEGELPCDCSKNVDFPELAFDLMLRLLDPNPFTRITAELALSHPFLAS